MTTPQIYGLFAMLTAAALAGFIFYCIGLRTGKAAGYEQGRTTEKNYWKKILGSVRADLGEARDMLDIRTRDTASLRESMQHLERDLLQRLAAAAPLTDEDLAVLLAVANKLELSADTFAGLNAHDHARFSRHLQAQVLDMADRLKIAQANTKPHPDSELIDWLEAEAAVAFECENCTLTFASNHGHELGIDTVRALLTQSKADSETVADFLGDLATPAQEDAA
ncbi:hypothetical protein DFO61_3327 [Ectopseudomonas oleovorans]|uniref:Uncharacterized protein n=1 Tax=Ectopseudomonas oleovorans TaxID=301 RepID=A0A397MIP9_ECTOL|nr:hypothetical protein [Pseudomonas oleovorans]RIA22637.1 hypothetical protein DFO61_3327 [Pseudomonas oleovorans]